MIKLDEVKFVLFDFDDTLCIHKLHNGSKELDTDYDKRVLCLGDEAYNKCDKNIHMEKFIQLCCKMNIRMGLISTTVSYQHMIAKNAWVAKQYGVNLENFCVGTFENKLRIMIAVSEAYNIPRERILIVDDFWENLERAANNGFAACSPMEVVNYITERG